MEAVGRGGYGNENIKRNPWMESRRIIRIEHVRIGEKRSGVNIRKSKRSEKLKGKKKMKQERLESKKKNKMK